MFVNHATLHSYVMKINVLALYLSLFKLHVLVELDQRDVVGASEGVVGATAATRTVRLFLSVDRQWFSLRA